jgi:hypothetical protein
MRWAPYDLRRPARGHQSRASACRNFGSVGRSGSLLKNADLALYKAKFDGKGKVSVFGDVDGNGPAATPADPGWTWARLRGRCVCGPFPASLQLYVRSIWLDLRLFYVGNHPERGLISPAEFIPIAEDTGLYRAGGSLGSASGLCDGGKMVRNPKWSRSISPPRNLGPTS